MSTKLSAGRVRWTYEFIKSSRDNHSVQAICHVGVAAVIADLQGALGRVKTAKRRAPRGQS